MASPRSTRPRGEDEELEHDVWLEAPVTQEVLDETPERALQFLRGIGSSRRILAAMSTRGYGREDHNRGWDLIRRVSGFDEHGLLIEPIEGETDAAAAIRELDALDESTVRLVRAVLGGKAFAEQRERALQGVTPTTGAGSVVTIQTLLANLDAIEERNTQADRDAIVKLARRGIHAGERARLRALVETAQSVPEVRGETPEQKEAARTRHNDLVLLREWYQEMAEIARTVLTRRDDRIRVGLARRKVRAAGGEGGGGSEGGGTEGGA